MYALDCDDFNTDYDPPNGHHYFATNPRLDSPGLLFDHMWRCIETGRVPIDRPDARTAILSDARTAIL